MKGIQIILLFYLPSVVWGQQNSDLAGEEKAVYAVVQELFSAYRDGDSSRVRAVFSDNAVLMRAGYKDGKSVASGGSIDSFVNYVGGGLEKLHNELLWDYTISVDKNLANIWTKYAFFLDGNFHHCGSETFVLYKSDSGWKIMALVDNNMVEECVIPDDIMEKGRKK